MSIRSKITTAVNLAFKGVGDLAETVTLKTQSGRSYNFSTGVATATETETFVTAIVIAQEENNTESKNTPIKEVYIKESDLPDPKLYDTITISSQDYSILSYKLEPGLIVMQVTEG
jgi:hypothetical protein